jgi:hypothetical protein
MLQCKTWPQALAPEEEARDYGNSFASRFGRIPNDAKIFSLLRGKKFEPLFSFIDEARIDDRLFDLSTSKLYRRGKCDGQPWWELERKVNFEGGE